MMYGVRQWARVNGLLGYDSFILVALQYNETSVTMQMYKFLKCSTSLSDRTRVVLHFYVYTPLLMVGKILLLLLKIYLPAVVTTSPHCITDSEFLHKCLL